MNPIASQQVSLDNALVAPENRVQIGKCNMRIDPTMTPKEPTYQVVLDALTTCYPAFLIIADVPEIYMQQFWFTIYKKDSTTYRFMIDKKRTFAAVINKCLSGKITVLDKLRLSRAQILWGMFYKKNVDFVELLWEDFTFQIDNRDHTKQEKMYYPRFTKAIIYHFITKDKTISMRNRLFMHTARKDTVLGTLRFVSKSDEHQVYGELLPKAMTNQKMKNSPAYKTYLAYATGAAILKKARKFKKPTSPSKKRALVIVEEEEPEPYKKVVPSNKPSRKQSTGVQIRDTHDGDSDEDNNDDDLQQADDEQTETDNIKTSDDEEETQDDECIHTPEDYVPTDDETNDESNDVNEEEYERINEELYSDVNVRLTDVEPANKEKDDEEMTVAGHVNVNQKGASNQVKDDAQVTQKSKIPLPSSSISSDYAAKFLNFDNIPPADTKIPLISMIKSEVPNVVKEFLRTNLDDALYKSIIEDENVMDKGVADQLKKRKPDDADKDKGPSARSDRGLKRQKTSKDTKPSKKAKSTRTSKGTPKSQPKSTGKTAQHRRQCLRLKILKGHRILEKTRVTLMNHPLLMLIQRISLRNWKDLLLQILSGMKATKYDLPGIEDMVPNLWSLVKVVYNKHALLVTNVKVKEWYGYGHLEEIQVRRYDQQLYKLMEGDFP
ncbi:hypothetical protein Tco_0241753 [Tanacetum coccineum]